MTSKDGQRVGGQTRLQSFSEKADPTDEKPVDDPVEVALNNLLNAGLESVSDQIDELEDELLSTRLRDMRGSENEHWGGDIQATQRPTAKFTILAARLEKLTEIAETATDPYTRGYSPEIAPSPDYGFE